MNGLVNHLPTDSFPTSGSGLPFIVMIPKGTVFAWDENMRNVNYPWTLTEYLPTSTWSLYRVGGGNVGRTITGKMASGSLVALTIDSVSILTDSKRVQLNSNGSYVTSASFTSTTDFYYLAYA